MPDHDRGGAVVTRSADQRRDRVSIGDLRLDVYLPQRSALLQQQLVDQRLAEAASLLRRRQRGLRQVKRSVGVHDHELSIGRQLTCRPQCRSARAVGAVISEHEASHDVEECSRSYCSIRGARYLEATLLGGDQVGASVMSELNPCPPVMRAVR